MARVIQDSDDELEEDLEADLLPPKQPNASDQPPSNDTHGTGSTGKPDYRLLLWTSLISRGRITEKSNRESPPEPSSVST
jgi:hypothetical protein